MYLCRMINCNLSISVVYLSECRQEGISSSFKIFLLKMKKLFGLSFQYTSLMLFTLSSHTILWIYLPHNSVVAAIL